MTHPASSSSSSSSLSSHHSSHHAPSAFPTPGAAAPASFTSASAHAASPSHASSSAAHTLSAPHQQSTLRPPSNAPAPASASALSNSNAATIATTSTAPSIQAGSTKVLPYLFDDALLDDVLVLVVDMLVKLTEHNDSLPLHPSALTRFHSRATPNISLSAYLRRIAKYTSIEKCCVLILLVYIDRVCERLEGFTICGLTVHRFICAAILCASKALCDAFNTNEHYAKVGGISLQEINLLEKEFLQIIDWRLICSGAELQHYYVSLVRNHKDYVLAEPKVGQQQVQMPAEMELDTGDAGASANGHGSSSGASASSVSRASSSSRDRRSGTRTAEAAYTANEAARSHYSRVQNSTAAGSQTPAVGSSQHSSPFPISSNSTSPQTPSSAVNGSGGLVAAASSGSLSGGGGGGGGRVASTFTSPLSAMQVDSGSTDAAAATSASASANSRIRKGEHRTPPSPRSHPGSDTIDASSRISIHAARSDDHHQNQATSAAQHLHQAGNAADTSKRSRLDKPAPQ